MLDRLVIQTSLPVRQFCSPAGLHNPNSLCFRESYSTFCGLFFFFFAHLTNQPWCRLTPFLQHLIKLLLILRLTSSPPALTCVLCDLIITGQGLICLGDTPALSWALGSHVDALAFTSVSMVCLQDVQLAQNVTSTRRSKVTVQSHVRCWTC